MALVPAPGGWGWRPGTNLAEVEPGDLPDLPFLRFLADRQARVRVLRTEAHRFPHGTKPKHLQERYGVPYATAWDVIHGSTRGGRHKKEVETT
jgi:hypothetical protein